MWFIVPLKILGIALLPGEEPKSAKKQLAVSQLAGYIGL